MDAPIDADGRVTVVARAGGPLHYPMRGVTEYVDAATLTDGLESLAGVPVERGHNGPVIGRVLGARVDGARILADLEIADPDARADIASGILNEASADYDIGRLDAGGVQVGPFRYRALALIPPGVSRCGPTCSVQRPETGVEHRLDCACSAPGAKENQTMKIKICGKEYDAGSPEADAAMSAAQARMDALEADVKRLGVERSIRIRLDAARAGVTARKDADDTTVMQEVIAKVFPSLDLSSQSPDWISGAFAAAIASLLDEEDSEPAPAAGAPTKPGEPPAMGAAGARADAMDARERARVDTHETAPADPPDVAARNKMIRRGQRLDTKD